MKSMEDYQQDPIKLYTIMRESLLDQMGWGKSIAQGQHLVDMIRVAFHRLDKQYDRYLETDIGKTYKEPFDGIDKLLIWQAWEKENHRKVVLKGDDKEWEKLKTEFGKELFLIRDAGVNKIPAGSETCCGLWPMRESSRPKILQRLQALE
jgi:peptidyl-tRNA hydrolase